MNNILVIVAHPDDEVLGCGGTIAKHTKNLEDGFSSRDIKTKDRNKPVKNAAEILGCENPNFLNFLDNQLNPIPLLNIVKKLEKVIANFQPNIIYTHHFGDLNIDHQITHKAVITACRPQPNFCVKEIYSFEILSATHWQSPSMGGAFNLNYFVDVSDFMDKKIQALNCYNAEIRPYPHARSYQAIKSLAQFRGSTVGLEYAESFCIERIIK